MFLRSLLNYIAIDCISSSRRTWYNLYDVLEQFIAALADELRLVNVSRDKGRITISYSLA